MNEIEKTYLILDLVVIILLSCFLSIFVNQNGEERYTSLMGVLTGLTYITSRLTNYKKIMNVFHFFIPITSLFIIIKSNDLNLLTLILSKLILAMATRKIFNGCIVRKIEEESELTSNAFTKLLNWDLIFPMMAFICLFRLYNLKK